MNTYIHESTPTVSPFIEAIQNIHLHQHVKELTRYRYGQEVSLLDLIFTNEEGLPSELKHKPGLGESDHECLYFVCNCHQEDIPKPIHRL